MSSKAHSSFLRAALAYAMLLLWPVFPLRPRNKDPLTPHGFLDATLEENQIREWWHKNPRANIGIPTGIKFWVLDIDPRNGGEESLQLLIAQHGALSPTIQQISGGGGRHYLFSMPPNGTEIRSGHLIRPDGAEELPGIDIKGKGGYIVVAPSLHPSGRAYCWDGLVKITEQQLLPAPDWLLTEIARAKTTRPPLRVPDRIEKGKQHDTLFKLGCSMRAKGFGETEIFAALWEANLQRCEEPGPEANIRKLAHSICEQFAAGDAGAPKPRPTMDNKRQKLNDDDWPEPSPLGCELPPVQTFSTSMLPEVLREPVEDIADRMQVPVDYPAACSIVVLAGAVNRRARIQPKRQDSSWIVVPNLWGGIIAPPGFLKSPVLKTATGPLCMIERLWREQYAAEQEEYEVEKEAAELRLASWKELSKAAMKKGTTPPLRPDTSLRPPTQKRLIVGDSTFEKTHELMKENPAGLLILRDELVGWLAQLDRQGREGERAFSLECWNGDSGFTVDRIGRGSIFVPACCLSMLGGITPGRLRTYLAAALNDGPANDGLIQRFQILVWPDAPAAWKYVDRLPAANRIDGMLRRLTDLDPEAPVLYTFDDAAQELFVAWLGGLESRIRNNTLHPALVSHLSKLRKTMPALAVLFALADDWEPPIGIGHARLAADWCAYLESHATRVYASVVASRMQAAAVLAERLRDGTVGADGIFARRDVYRHHWTGLDTPENVGDALEILEDAGWVRSKAAEGAMGRPADLWLVNPRIFGPPYSAKSA